MKRLKRIFRTCILIALILGILGAAAVGAVNLHIYNQTKSRIVTVETIGEFDADCILVLGAGVRDDGTPSHMLNDRLLTGISLYEAGASPKLLMSGDHGRAVYDEVNCMKDFAKEKGVPSEDIFMDHAGFSTYETMYRAKAIFGAEKVLIVTQRYHLYRALYIARQLGMEAYGVDADYRTYSGQTMRDIREVLARCKDFAMCIFMPEPTYLGETIPISGNGALTHDENSDF